MNFKTGFTCLEIVVMYTDAASITMKYIVLHLRVKKRLRCLYQKVDSYIRKINELVPKLKDEFKRQRDINAKIIHDGDKEYHVILSINEQNIPRMTIDISLPTEV